MSDVGVKYLEFHIENTFNNFMNSRHLLHVDWFEDQGIRAAMYMSRENVNMTDAEKLLNLNDITDIVLLCPPIEESDLDG